MKKSILITGCSTGIGRDAAIKLHQMGYQVIASVRNPSDIESLRSEGLPHVIELDLANSESIKKAVDETLSITKGQIYALFNNGAYAIPGAVEDLSRDALRTQFETNLFGTHELTTLLLPTLMEQEDARIVQCSSVLGIIALPFRGAYNASKFALEGLTDTLRLELRRTSVKVSLIEPGPILTDFRKNSLLSFEKYIDIENSRHTKGYQSALKRLRKSGAAVPFTLGPEAVTKKLIHALEAKKPRARYYVTFPTYLMGYLKRVFSTKLLDRFLLEVAKSD